MAINTLAHKVEESGKDGSVLRRWGYTHFQGKKGRKLRIIILSWPAIFIGASSVCVQQLRHLIKKKDVRDLRKGLLYDLKTEINIDEGRR